MKLRSGFKLSFFICIAAVGCTNKTESTQATARDTFTETMAGNYVSSDYPKRKEGYDWVAVSVKLLTDSAAHIRIRSRADRKRPTCTFDADAVQSGDHLLKAAVEGKIILFSFAADSLTIQTGNEEDSGILNYFCSGGGSLAGSYQKIKDPLDKKQIDSTVFLKVLSMQNIFFDIRTTGEGSLQQLIIQPAGLEKDNTKITLETDGSVTNAEIEDLNSDGFPEILIYTVSAGSGSYGNVIAYSVNNGKSMSPIYFPGIADNPKANKGYLGHDEFAIVETHLVQRFRVYNPGDPNCCPTGKIRQVHYKLVDGENSRKFVVDNITEYSGSAQ